MGTNANDGVLRFFGSPASAFVTGQPLRVTKTAKGDQPVGDFTKPLKGKVVLITGAARGIGAATAEILAGEGAQVVVLDRPADDQPASEVAQMTTTAMLGFITLLVDVPRVRVATWQFGSMHSVLWRSCFMRIPLESNED